MKHTYFLAAIAAIVLSACEAKIPESKRFPNAQIKFEYREYEPFKVEFMNTSTPKELDAYIWRFGIGSEARSIEHPYCGYPQTKNTYNVLLTCIDNYRLKIPYNSTYYDSVYYNSIFLYTDSAYIYVTGEPHDWWTPCGFHPDSIPHL